MPSITCKAGGAGPHTHHSREEVKAHWQAHYGRGAGRDLYHNTRATIAVEPAIDDQLSAMLMNTKDGRYAVKMHADDPFKFIRLSRPNRGKARDYLKIQSQHAEALASVGLIHTSLEPRKRYLYAPSYIPYLRMLACDPTTAAMDYGREMRRCSRCGIQLTDDKSRWFSIGPECEKHWPDIIAMVLDKKGPYVPGWES